MATAKNTRTRIALEALGKYYDVAAEPLNVEALLVAAKLESFIDSAAEVVGLGSMVQNDTTRAIAEKTAAALVELSKTNLIKSRDLLASFYGTGTTIPTVQALGDLDATFNIGNLSIGSTVGEENIVPGQNAGVLSLIPFDNEVSGQIEDRMSQSSALSYDVTVGEGDDSTKIFDSVAASSVFVRQKQNPIGGVFETQSGDNYYTMQHDALNAKSLSSESPTPVHAILNYLVSAAPTVINSDLTTVLANGVPPLEWSRCVPYLEVMLATETGTHKIATSFLMPEGVAADIAENEHPATLTGIDPDFEIMEDAVRKYGDSSSYTLLGSMDIFTMPQTLINRRHIDPFRPMASIESFTNTLSGFISTSKDPAVSPTIKDQKATLRLRIHHPSYLDELAPLVKPSHTGTTKIVITYGWSHPDGGANRRSSDADLDSRWGDLLNACKTTEVFSILNSRLSFTDANEVQVDVELSQSATGQELVEKLINSSELGVPAREIDGLLEQVVDTFALNLENATGTRDYNFNYKVFSSRLQKDQVLSKESGDALKQYLTEVNKYVRSNQGKTVRGKNLNAVGLAKLQELFIDTFGERNASAFLTAAKSSNPTFTSKSLLAGLSKIPDPFLAVCGQEKHAPNPQLTIKRLTSKPKKHAYISFGKIASYFVGTSLSKLEGYSEVQMVFHPFNRDAGAAHYLTVGNFPIERKAFDAWFKDYVKKEGFISTQKFIDAVISRFIHTRGQSKAYGIKGLKKESEININLAKSYGYDDPGGLTFAPKFVNPKIEVTTRSGLPRQSLSELAPPSEDPDPDLDQRPILRIEFSDAECSTLAGFLNEMSDSLTNGGAFPKRVRRPGVKQAEGTNQVGVDHNSELDAYVRHFEQHLKILKPAPLPDSDAFKELVEKVKSALSSNTDKTISDVDGLLTKMLDQYYRVHVSTEGVSTREVIKSAASSTVPGTIIYGALGSAMTSCSIQTSQDQRFINLALLDRRSEQQKKDDKAQNIEPMKLAVLPLEVDISLLGQPYIYPGQEYYLDLKTGTNVDQMYRVMSVEHIIEPGKYETKAKLTPSHGGPSYSSAKSSVANFLAGRMFAAIG